MTAECHFSSVSVGAWHSQVLPVLTVLSWWKHWKKQLFVILCCTQFCLKKILDTLRAFALCSQHGECSWQSTYWSKKQCVVEEKLCIGVLTYSIYKLPVRSTCSMNRDHRITESQNHSITEWGLLEGHLPQKVILSSIPAQRWTNAACKSFCSMFGRPISTFKSLAEEWSVIRANSSFYVFFLTTVISYFPYRHS